MADEDRDEATGAQKLLDAGVDIAGNVGGALIGAVIAGPGGAVAGGVAGPLITHAIHAATEFAQRQLSRREEVRVGATLRFAIEKIQKNLANGQTIRQDAFFINSLSDRSTANEIVEGVLLAAQREHEERKLRFYGNLVANIAFEPNINRPLANQLLQKGENLSYQQLCLLTLFLRRQEFPKIPQDIAMDTGVDKLNIVEDLYDIFQQGLFLRSNVIIPNVDYAVQNLVIYPTELGRTLHNLMELQEIKHEEFEGIIAILRRGRP